MKSIEKLRESLKACTSEAGVELNRFDTYWITARACDVLIDGIEAEIAERYMELPVDADGMPIHMGDAVEGELLDDSTVKGTVCAFHLYDDEPNSVYIHVNVDGGGWTIKELRLTRCHHVKQRTVEDVLRDFVNEAEWEQSPDSYEEIERRLITLYAAELRDLLGGDCS